MTTSTTVPFVVHLLPEARGDVDVIGRASTLADVGADLIEAAPQAAVIRGIPLGRCGPSRRLGVAFGRRYLRRNARGQNLDDPQRAVATVGKLDLHGIPGASAEKGAADRGSGRNLMASGIMAAPPDEHELGYPT